ncbi:hypothetical protein BH10PSE14_BH10PSE14_41100 [soil metagenome]
MKDIAVSKATMINEIDNAIGAHGMWKMRLNSAIKSGKCDEPSGQACRDDLCAFGKWLCGPSIDASTKAGMPFQVVKRVHADFHKAAGSVLANVERGDLAAARTIVAGAYNEQTEKLVRALMKWKRELADQTRTATA